MTPKPVLAWLLGVNAGFVDTAGFLALHGLFTTHVTGNFVTLGASLVGGSGGALPKLAALPLFCAVVALTRLLAGHGAPTSASLRAILALKMLLLAGGALLAIRCGPFADGDGWAALTTGMLLVAAMAIQNALQRIHLTQYPPTTVMTGNVTQFMVDLAELSRTRDPQARAVVLVRARVLGIGILTFAAGCAAGAALYATCGMWCFALPPLVALMILSVVQSTPP